MDEQIRQRIRQTPELAPVSAGMETVWFNPGLRPFPQARDSLPLTAADIDDAEARLDRFAPFLKKRFPETAPLGGKIESPLSVIPEMQRRLNDCGAGIQGRLLLKRDSDLPIAGSVKARGGIYEVLKHAEELALSNGLLHAGDSYEAFDSPEFRAFFRQYAVHVGSTGNLGLSIGIMSAAIGFRVTVHMSADAKQWKKDLLRQSGVTVREYASDYSAAVQEGRRLAADDPFAYFVDDENSLDLFLGYAVAGRRLAAQLAASGIAVDHGHPLAVYIPCGVGGAPGGITFGLKHEFGDDVSCFFAEPTQAPCMLLGMATGLHSGVCVQDAGLTGKTLADGLAVGRPSGLVGRLMEPLLSGETTVRDAVLFDYMRALWDTEGLFIEPSACAAFHSAVQLSRDPRLLPGADPADVTHIVWATGGRLVPEAEREIYRNTFPEGE